MVDYFDVVKLGERFVEHWQKPAVDLHRHHLVRPFSEFLSEHANPRADLNDSPARPRAAELGNFRADPGLIRKFCPRDLEKVNPWRLRISLITEMFERFYICSPYCCVFSCCL